ncbi:MAG: polyphenol oxidase family protein [Actinomycetaceae bacterium]|nr:polyphenol oxidase family protein [Actinomycetaceae bacterium]
MSVIEWAFDQAVPGARVRAGFTQRRGGVSEGPYAQLNLGFHVGDDPQAVRSNREILEACVPGLGWMDQVHGRAIALAEAGRTAGATDALVVDPADNGCTAAAVMVADCVPLLIVARDQPVAAAVHVGRGGFLASIAPGVVAAMRARGCHDLVAILGPSICGRCYEVPAEMRAEAEAVAAEAASTTSWSSPSIDIPAGLVSQLKLNGVSNVIRSDSCTFEDEAFFSHRRATAAGTQTGRFAGVVQVLRDTPA